MSSNFEIYKKDNGDYLGSGEALDPKTAAQAVLKFPLSTNCINAQEESNEIITLDDNNFEISIAGEEYTVKKSVEDLATQD